MNKTLSLMMLTVGTLAAQTLTYFPQVAQAPEYARAIAADSTGLYVAGEVRQIYYTTDDAHAFLRRFDSQGAVIWTRTFDIATAATAVAVSASGIYVGGYTAAAPTVHDAFLRRYDSGGNQVWTRQFTVQANTRLSSLIADDAGVYAVAWSSPQNDSFPGYSASWTLRRFDADGQELWSLPLDGKPGILHADATGLYFIDGAYSLASPRPAASLQKYSRSGARMSAKVLGNIVGALLAANSEGLYTTTVTYSQDGQIAGRKFQSFDYDGNLRWTRAFPSELGEYNSSAIAADEDGFYFAGSLYGTLEGQCRSGSLDLQVRRFDSEGNRIWQRQFGTDQDDLAGGITVAPDRLYVFESLSTAVIALDKNPTAPAGGPRIHNECVLNAANYAGGALAPGEMVTILGTSLGPDESVAAPVSSDAPLPQVLGATRVLFNGVPGALMYVSDRQTTAIVPYGIADAANVDVRVEYRGVSSNPVRLPVRPTRLGVFSMDGSGQGAAAAFNQDGTLNSTSNPAHSGSVITFYATGAALQGQASERDVVSLPSSPIKAAIQVFLTGPSPEDELAWSDHPAWATLGMYATPLYAGGVTGSVSGLIQIQVRLPGDWYGSGTYLQLSAPGAFVSSQATIAVAKP